MHTTEVVPSDGLTGLLLCGGSSRRFGRDKALVRVGATTLAERAVMRLRAACDPIILAHGDRHLDVEGCLGVVDAVADAGPLGGLVAGLEASPHPLLAAVAVDMPFIDAALLTLLASSCAGFDAAVPVTERGPEPLHAVYSRPVAQAGRRLAARGEHSLRALLGDLHVCYVPEAAWRDAWVSPLFALNLNSPADLGALGPAAGS